MLARLSVLLAVSILLSPATAKDKNKGPLPDFVVQAQTVRVVVIRDSGTQLDHPVANSNARDEVERAIEAWGRYALVHEGENADLVIAVRSGTGKVVSPTVETGTTDSRIEGVQTGKLTIGAQQGRVPALSDPNTPVKHTGPHLGKQVGGNLDKFEVYQGGVAYTNSAPPVWRYTAKDALKAPDMVAVREFRKAVAATEAQKNKP